MAFDLNKMSLSELKKLQKDVAKAIKTSEQRKKKEALAAADAAVKEFGFNLRDLTGNTAGDKKSKTTSAPKYRHPKDPEITWTGRGRQPKWFVEALESGKSKEDMLMK